MSSVQAKVEHPFQILKCQCGYRKTRYRGLEKNDGQIVMLCALVNIFMLRRPLRHLEMSDSAVCVCLKNGKSEENGTKYEKQRLKFYQQQNYEHK